MDFDSRVRRIALDAILPILQSGQQGVDFSPMQECCSKIMDALTDIKNMIEELEPSQGNQIPLLNEDSSKKKEEKRFSSPFNEIFDDYTQDVIADLPDIDEDSIIGKACLTLGKWFANKARGVAGSEPSDYEREQLEQLCSKILYYIVTGTTPLDDLEYGFRALIPGTSRNLPQVHKQSFIPSDEQSGAIILQCCAQMKVMCEQMKSRIDQLPTKDEVTDLLRRYS